MPARLATLAYDVCTVQELVASMKKMPQKLKAIVSRAQSAVVKCLTLSVILRELAAELSLARTIQAVYHDSFRPPVFPVSQHSLL